MNTRKLGYLGWLDLLFATVKDVLDFAHVLVVVELNHRVKLVFPLGLLFLWVYEALRPEGVASTCLPLKH